MGMEWSDQTGDFLAKGAGVQSVFDRLSVGSQMHQTKDGFCIKPGAASEDYADVVLDLTQLESTVEYFTALVGLDDFARFDLVSSGGSVKYQVLAGQKVLAETDVLTSGETAAISCAVPSGTTELTLRVTMRGTATPLTMPTGFILIFIRKNPTLTAWRKIFMPTTISAAIPR